MGKVKSGLSSLRLLIILIITLLLLSGCNKDIRYSTEEAQALALADLGFIAQDVTFTKSELEIEDDEDKDDDEIAYYIVFISNGIEYIYYISALNGNVVYKTQVFASIASVTNGITYIGLDAAKESALTDAGASGQTVVYTTTNLEKGLWATYDIGFIYNHTRYEYEINAGDGSVIDCNTENILYVSLEDDNITEYTGIDKAKYYTLTYVGLNASDVIFTRLDLDVVEWVTVYEIEFISGSKQYKFEINAVTGTILRYSST